MQTTHDLRTIPDDEILLRLAALLSGSRHTEADLVAHIGEVDARRLYLREATPSMFAYCTERLHLSEGEACLRIAAARASREHPVVLEMLSDGRLHLSGIAKLAPHLTPENRDVLLGRATHRTRRQVDELVAEVAPRPDVPASVRKLPAGRAVARTAPGRRMELLEASADERAGADAELPALELKQSPLPEWVDSDRSGASGPARSALDEREPKPALPRGSTGPAAQAHRSIGAGPGDSPAVLHAAPQLAWVAAPLPRPARIEPLAPARYKVQFTASAELRDKLERLKALMRSSVRDGDLAAVIDAAVTEKLERMEARRFGTTRSPLKTVAASDTSGRTRAVPAAVRRVVAERDGDRCVFVDRHGNRCTTRGEVEFHHRKPFAVGGDHSPGNVSVLCRQHNRYVGEIDFGRSAVTNPHPAKATPSARPSP